MAEIIDLTVTPDPLGNLRFPEDQPGSTLNDGNRDLESIIARWYRDWNGSLVTTGTLTAYDVAANRTISSYYDGLSITATMHLTCGDSPTFNVDAQGARPIVRPTGTPITQGELPAGAKVSFRYSATNDNWQVVSSTMGDRIEGVASITDPIFANGADPTGTNAADASFQAVIDQGFGHLFLPRQPNGDVARYRLDGTWDITKQINVMGPGLGFFTVNTTGGAVIFPSGAANNLIHVNASGVLLQGFSLEGRGDRFDFGQGDGIVIGEDERTITDGAIDVGVSATTLNSPAQANYTSADIGKFANVAGAYTSTTSTPRITTINGPTSVELDIPADVTVSGATVKIAFAPRGVVLRDIGMWSHSIGVHMKNGVFGSLWNCMIQSHNATRWENVAPDAGEHNVFGGEISSDKNITDTRNVYWLSGGSLGLFGVKFINAYDSILAQWTSGQSGGFRISGCLSENVSRSHLRMIGDGATKRSAGNISGTTFTSGTQPFHIDDNAVIEDLKVSGLIIRSAVAPRLLYIGANVKESDFSTLSLDGGGFAGAVGIDIASGTSDITIGVNSYRNLATNVNDASGVAKFPGSWDFVSAPQVVAGGALRTVAHGLGIEPNAAEAVLRCTTADSTFSVGDVLQVSFTVDLSSNGGHLFFDATNLNYQFAVNNPIYAITTAGTAVVLTPGSWELILRARV